MAKLSIIVTVDGRTFTLKGRVAWALCELHRAGTRGVTPFDAPGPRWSAYVHALRREHLLDIETVHEKHGGPFPGQHARYILRSRVHIATAPEEEKAAA
jgi:hypothetical protein